jgi:thiol-disulfide isomerase/thioredoxin
VTIATAPAAAAILILGGLVCVSTMLAGVVRADSTRFIPWKDSTAPALALNDLGGSPRSLTDYRGRILLLNFWATWCEPCRDELASITKLQEQLAGKPFVVLLINYGEARARVADFVKRESIAFPILLDPNQDASKAWRVRVLPSSFLVGQDGRVRYSVIGEIDWARADAVEIVQSLLR